MISWKSFSNLVVFKSLRMKSGAVLTTENADGSTTSMDVAELAALNDLGAADLQKIDGITNGVAAANKAVVLDGSKGVATITSATITTLTSTTANVPTVNATNVDAGASGTAGTVDVFPGAAASGKIAIVAAASGGDFTTTVTNASQAGARSYTIPDAGGNAQFVMNAGAQSIAGNKTFTGVTRSPRVLTSEGVPTSLATVGNETYTAAQLLTGIIVRDCAGGARTDTLDSAANIVAAVSGAAVGDVIRCWVVNGSDAAETITLAVPASGAFDTNQTAASRVISQNVSKMLHIRLTNVTNPNEAYVLYA